MIIFIFNVRIGIHFLMLLGTLMICACFSYGLIIINQPHIVLPWNRAHCTPDPADDEWCALLMRPSFGWSWYLVLFTGIITFFCGVVLYIIDFFLPRYTAAVFHHSIIEADDEFRSVRLLYTIYSITIIIVFVNWQDFHNFLKLNVRTLIYENCEIQIFHLLLHCATLWCTIIILLLLLLLVVIIVVVIIIVVIIIVIVVVIVIVVRMSWS